MIIAAHRTECARHPELFEQMYQLRAKSFAERRGWTVNVSNGQEVDVFDDLNPLYIMSVSPSGKLVASLRLLQTTGPHMLSDVFPETMTGSPLIRHPLIWESSRFCVDTEEALNQRGRTVHMYTVEILLGMLETARDNAIINVVSVYDLLVERILRRVGCPFDRLGEPFEYDGLKTVAGLSQPPAEAVKSIRAKSKIGHDIFSANHETEEV